MNIENLTEYTKLLGPLLSGLSLLFGVIYFVINLRRDRAKQTLEYWEKVNQELKVEKRKLLKDYGSKIEREMAELIIADGDEQARINKVINIYERLSLGVNIGAYDIQTLNKLVGQNIIDNYSRFEEYILARRKKMDRPFAWTEFQKLSSKLVRIRRGPNLTSQLTSRLRRRRR